VTSISVSVPDGVDAGIAWHYGDPLREQRTLATSVGVVDRSNRGVLVVAGDDRLAWLHSICSQHLTGLADGDSTEALVLSAHGHVEQHWQVTELNGRIWLDVEPDTSAEALGYLEKMRFFKRVEPADVSTDWAVLSLVGPRTADTLGAAGLPIPAAGHAVALSAGAVPAGAVPAGAVPAGTMPAGTMPAGTMTGGGFVRRMAWPSSDAADLVVPRASASAVLAALRAAGAQPAGVWAFEALRIEARRPRLGFETDHRTIPHEVGWIGSAVHLNKGCYRGQETVARVQNLGRPPRRMVVLHLGGASDVLPAAGTPVEFAGRTIGFLGTAVHHFELGPIGLAVIKRSLPADAALTVAGDAVGVDAGPDA
jgi:tRNA-modifying protein YgfZ